MKGEEVGGIVPNITLESIANGEPLRWCGLLSLFGLDQMQMTTFSSELRGEFTKSAARVNWLGPAWLRKPCENHSGRS
jgi:hypothetical protein